MIVELIERLPNFLTPVYGYGSLIYTVIYMSDRLLTQADPNHDPPTIIAY